MVDLDEIIKAIKQIWDVTKDEDVTSLSKESATFQILKLQLEEITKKYSILLNCV